MMLAEGINFLRSLDFRGFIYVFWYYVIFDFSRYFLSACSVAMSATLEKRRETSGFRPLVSVLLAGFNEADSLRRSARSLREQTLDGLELIVIDDGSTDDMVNQALALKREGLIDRVLSTGIRGGKSSAVNLGLQHCSHGLVAVADVDTSFDRDAFEKLVAPLADPSVGAVSGNLAVRNASGSMLTRFQALEYLTSISLGRRFTAMLGILPIVSGAFGIFRRTAVESVGGWEVGPGEDADITEKLRVAGWRIEFAPHAWAMTDVPARFPAFVRQRLRWNRSVIRFRWLKYRRVHDPRTRAFSWLNLVSTLNILFFQVVLAISFYIYIGWLVATFGAYALAVLVATAILYVVEDMVTFVLVCVLYPEREPVRLWPYLFGYGLFSTFVQRTIRLLAYIDELIFGRSYSDPYVPDRVSKAAERF